MSGDIIFSHDMAIILVKWSKTNELMIKVVKVSIPVCQALCYAL